MTATQTSDCVGSCSADAIDVSAQQLRALKALADPVRLHIVARLAASTDESVCACSMPESFGVSQPTMSHHLKKLVEAGILDREMRGNWAHFSLRRDVLASLQSFIASVTPAEPRGTLTV